MKIISSIKDKDVIRRILEHLGLWKEVSAQQRAPPFPDESPDDISYEPFDDGWPGYEEPYVSVD